jgi:hypothetical protein
MAKAMKHNWGTFPLLGLLACPLLACTGQTLDAGTTYVAEVT